MELHLNIIGYSLMVLAFLHLILPHYFNWSKELKLLSLFNRQLIIVHTFFIALIVFMMGLFCITNTQEIITTPLGKTIALGLSIFWGIRLIFQLFVYSNKLWKGKTFETSIHIFAIFFWAYLCVIFYMIYSN